MKAFCVNITMEFYEQQDTLVRKAIETDELRTKEEKLRAKILLQQAQIPQLCNYPYVIDVEYLCFDHDAQFKVRPGRGDLLFTNGNGEYVAVEIKSAYVCFNGVDRVYVAKTTKLMEQVRFYQEYQQLRLGPSCTVHGCGITEQKIYWLSHEKKLEEYWWCTGPDEVSVPHYLHDAEFIDIDDMPEEYLELHEMFLEESISRMYPILVTCSNGKIVYTTRCKNKKITVCKEHLCQKDINEIKNSYTHGQIMMFGEARPSLITF
jgi:hypothetical protein